VTPPRTGTYSGAGINIRTLIARVSRLETPRSAFRRLRRLIRKGLCKLPRLNGPAPAVRAVEHDLNDARLLTRAPYLADYGQRIQSRLAAKTGLA
jgi:hypothetical protein